LRGISSRAFNEARAAVIIGSLDTTLTLKHRQHRLWFVAVPTPPPLALIGYKAGNVAFAEA
jgi:hypothetical protein